MHRLTRPETMSHSGADFPWCLSHLSRGEANAISSLHETIQDVPSLDWMDVHWESEWGSHITISYVQHLSPTVIYLISRIQPCIAPYQVPGPCYISGEKPSRCPTASLDPTITVLHSYNNGLSHYGDLCDASTSESQQSRMATSTSP